MKPIERLIEFQQSVKDRLGGQNKFEAYVGISNGYLSRMYNTMGDIGSNVISSISDKFPDLNIDWLITGRGDMLVSNSAKVSVGRDNSGVAAGIINGDASAHTIKGDADFRSYTAEKIIRENGDTELYNDAQSVIDRLEVENSALKQRVSDLENMIVSKDELISSLKDMIELLKHR